MILKVLGLLFASAVATCAQTATAKKAEDLGVKVEDIAVAENVTIQKEISDLKGFDCKNYLKQNLINFEEENNLVDKDLLNKVKENDTREVSYGFESMLTLDQFTKTTDDSATKLSEFTTDTDTSTKKGVRVITEGPGGGSGGGSGSSVQTYTGHTECYYGPWDLYEFNGHGHTWYIMEKIIPITDVEPTYWWTLDNLSFNNYTWNEFFEFSVNFYSDTGDIRIYAQTTQQFVFGYVNFTYTYRNEVKPAPKPHTTQTTNKTLPTIPCNSNNASYVMNGSLDGYQVIGILLRKDWCINFYNNVTSFLNGSRQRAYGATFDYNAIYDNLNAIAQMYNYDPMTSFSLISIDPGVLATCIGAIAAQIVLVADILTFIFDVLPIVKVILTIAAIVVGVILATMFVCGYFKCGFGLGWAFRVFPWDSKWLCGPINY